MQFQTKKILVAVKAYPNPSRKHVETVCFDFFALVCYTLNIMNTITYRTLHVTCIMFSPAWRKRAGEGVC